MSDTRRIRPLSTQLANQIAAGEVVERPASVLKELLENALDAGAAQLTVEAEGGGVRRLQVRDDGAGIHPEDLPLAVTRHATSKIRTPEELAAVASLGFRGEALASIAAVARLRLTSRRPEADSGWRLAVDAGEEVPEPLPAAHPVGTTVEIRELFFNTPARRKFLRAERTELAHLDEVVRRLALARPDVGLHFSHNGRVRLNLSPASASDRLAGVLGNRDAGACRPLSRELALGGADGAELTINGWVAPEAGEVHAFVNGRAIRDRLVQTALRRAGEELGLDGSPTAVLHLGLDPAQVDVNVHPAKSEVRFRAARDVHDALVAVVREALSIDGAPATGGAETGLFTGDDPSAVGGLSGYTSDTGATRGSSAPYPGVAEGRAPWDPEAGEIRVLACWPEDLALLDGAPPRVLDCRVARAELYRRRLHAGLAGDGVPARRLLVPVVLADSAAAEIGERHGEALRRLGLEWTPCPEGVRLQRLPDITADADPQAWVARLVAELAGVETPVEPTEFIEPIARCAADSPAAAPSPGAVAELVRALEGGGGLPEAAVRPLEASMLRGLFV